MTSDIQPALIHSAANNKATIISMAVIVAAIGAVLHEGIGHGVTSWLRGDVPTMLTSNHLSDLRPDRLVSAGGTIVNLIAGAIAMYASALAVQRANLRYFLWLLGAFNLMEAAGYFLFSGILGLGDWEQVIASLPRQALLRTIMTLFGAVLYIAVVKIIAINIKPFCPTRSTYNTVGRLPYYAACIAGAFDPLGIKLLFLSSIPAAFGGLSGFMWADSLLPHHTSVPTLVVSRQPAWWIAAIVIGLAYVLILGRGIHFAH